MPDKSADTQPQDKQAPGEIPPIMKEADLSKALGAGTQWVEALSEMGSEMVSFLAERIKEDVKTQHQILHCKSITELQHIQAQFIEKAIEQYNAETGKLFQMGTNALKTPKTKDDS
jgi:hypothetical protein